MGSLGDSDRLAATHFSMAADVYDDGAADNMKHMVMAFIAVALVFATIIGTLVLSGAVHKLSGVLCAAVHLPSLIQLS